MRCPNCANLLPNAVMKCPHCTFDVNISSERKNPVQDKYGAPVKLLSPDWNKYDAREKYLFTFMSHNASTFSSTNQYSIQNSSNQKNKKYGTIILVIIIFVVVFYIFFNIMSISAVDIKSGFTFALGIMVLISIRLIPFFISKKIRGNKIEYENETLNFDKELTVHKSEFSEIHGSKPSYYVSENVIGYSDEAYTSFNGEIKKQYYEYYEFDKRDIISIKYNPTFADYELHFNHPVCIKYNAPPQYIVYIADIFSDTKLSEALERDLPPKQMNF